MYEPPTYITKSTNLHNFACIKYDSLSHTYYMKMNIIYVRNK